MKQTNWNRNSIENAGQKYDLLLLFVVVLSIISLITNQTLIFLVTGFVAIYVLLIRVYDKRIGRKLTLENKKRSIRLFEGENGNLDLTLYNHSFLPYLNASASFSTNSKIESDGFLQTRRGQLNYYQVPFILLGNSEARLSIPLKAIKRGVIHVENIQLTFPHLMNFERIEMKHLGKYQTEILVYPKLIPVAGIEEFPYNNFGNQVTPFSPFEDLLSPLGARDYVQSDPFHRIHWKASAKNQTLQTKNYERNRNISWTLIVNIAETSPLGNVYMSNNLEKLLSQAAFICQTITKQGYSIELYINASRAEKVPFSLEEGIGLEHLKKTLELLTRIEDDNNVLPITNFLHHVDHKMNDSNRLIMIGTIDSQSQPYTNKWNRRGNHVLHVADSKNGAYLTEIKSERLNDYGVE